MGFNSTHDTCEVCDLSIPGGHYSALPSTTTCRNTTTLYLRISDNKQINVVNLWKVTNTYVCGTPNELDASSVASILEIGTNTYIGVEGLLS